MGQTFTMDDAPVVQAVRELVGGVSEDEAALVRTLTPSDLTPRQMTEHLAELAELVETVRADEAMADYVFAIAPTWDGTIETLLLGARVTTLFANHQIERRRVLVAA